MRPSGRGNRFSPPPALRGVILTILCGLLLSGCSGGGSGGGAVATTPPPSDDPPFRAIAGISMGAYGAMNLGGKHPDLFAVIGSLGGPVDQQEFLQHLHDQTLEVKAQVRIPSGVGDDFTFDHLPAYPSRDVRLSILRDLIIAFGNPFLHHEDPDQQYLARHSQPAAVLLDDQFGDFFVPVSVFGFSDGGDANEDGLRQVGEIAALPTHALLLAGGTSGDIAGVPPQVVIGQRALTDLDGDGVFDVGDGIILNGAEPFTDSNANLVYEPELGESFMDWGLDGVPGTSDFGELNGSFDYDPDRARWLAEDPIGHLQGRSPGDIARQRIYMDVGTQDEFGLEDHYLHLVATLESKGLSVALQDGFLVDCLDLPDGDDPYRLVRFDGGHFGIAGADDIVEELAGGDICGPALIFKRLLSLLGFMDQSFPEGFYGPGGFDPLGETIAVDVPSPALAVSPGDPFPTRRVVIYRPPAFRNTNLDLPVVYFLGGYGQSVEDFLQVGDLLDLLILSGQLQNMVFVFLPGDGGFGGSFYVNQAIPESQIPVVQPTSGRYEDSMLEDLIPFVEEMVLDGRLKLQ